MGTPYADCGRLLSLNTLEQRADGSPYSTGKDPAGGLNLLFMLPAFDVQIRRIFISFRRHSTFI